MNSPHEEDPSDEEAKRIFLEHGGSTFYMSRSGMYETYKNFGISWEKENAWLREGLDELLAMPITPQSLLDFSYNCLIDRIIHLRDTESLEVLLEKVEALSEDLDTMSVLLTAEGILKLLHNAKSWNAMRDKRLNVWEKRIVDRLLVRASEKKLTIAQIYYGDPTLNRLISDQHLVERIALDRRELERFSDLG